MPPFLHPEAAKRFEELAAQLCLGLSAYPKDAEQPSRSAHGDLPIGPTITAKDIEGPIVLFNEDQDGNEIARYSTRGGETNGFAGEAHRDFLVLAKRIHDSKGIRDQVSLKTVASLVFDWCLDSASRLGTDPLCPAIVGAVTKAILPQTLVFPIHELLLEEPVPMRGGEFRSITRSDFDRWLKDDLERSPQAAKATEEMFAGLRKRLQGRAAYWISLTAEPERAREVAIARADECIALLRLFSRGMFQPKARSYVTRWGFEDLHSTRFFTLADSTYKGYSSGFASPTPFHWNLRLAQYKSIQPALDVFTHLIDRPDPTDFEEELSRAVLLYSRVALYENLGEKILHILVPLESILLKNESESIVQNVGDRIAFLVGRKADERIAIVQLIREVYTFRSRYVHHGDLPRDDLVTLDTLRRMLALAFRCFLHLATYHDRFQTRDDLFQYLDRRKYA